MNQSIFDGRTDQTLCTFLGYRFYTERRRFRETDLRHSHLIAQEGVELLGLGSTLLPFDSGIDVFRILAEDMHVHLLGFLQRRSHSLEPTDRTQADVQIQCLAQGHIQGTDTSSHRSGQRSLDTDQILAESLHRSLRQPFTGLLERLSSGQYFFPFDGALAVIGSLHRRIDNLLTYRGNFRPHTVSFDKRNCHLIGNHQLPVFHIYFTHTVSSCLLTVHFTKVFNADPALNQPICMAL